MTDIGTSQTLTSSDPFVMPVQPLGLKKNGTLLLNPSDDVIVEEGDEVLVLAEDDDSYEANDGEFTVCVSGKLPPVAPRKNEPECILFCGWRRDMADMIKDLDLSVTPHSELWLLNSVPPTHRQALLLDKGNKEELALINLTIKHSMGNHYSKRDLKTIQAVSHENDSKLFHSDGTPLTKSLHEFNSILILAEQVCVCVCVCVCLSLCLCLCLLHSNLPQTQS